MKYNLSPILNVVNEHAPNSQQWRNKIERFFSKDYSEEAGSAVDNYYDILLVNLGHIVPYLRCGYLIDEYSGLFTLNTPNCKMLHTFNLANFIRKNYLYFNKKSIRTVSMDYGILNVQIKECGLNLSSTTLAQAQYLGAVLTVIGNESIPYVINAPAPNFDVIFAAHIFNTEDEAYNSWTSLFDAHLTGKEVFFTTTSFKELKKFVNYDRIKLMEKPNEIYDKELYSNLDYGYGNKIYRIV